MFFFFFSFFAVREVLTITVYKNRQGKSGPFYHIKDVNVYVDV